MIVCFQSVKKCSAIFLCSTMLSACSVWMAADGEREPDLSVVKNEVHRTDVEAQLGAPISITQQPNGTSVAIYQCVLGKESSAGRAVAHGVMDVLTLGIWEIVGTPIERLKGDKVMMTITYDPYGRVISAVRA